MWKYITDEADSDSPMIEVKEHTGGIGSHIFASEDQRGEDTSSFYVLGSTAARSPVVYASDSISVGTVFEWCMVDRVVG